MLYGPRYLTLRQALVGARLGAGLTQAVMAQRMGRAQSFISKVEIGERYVDVIDFVDWCQITGVDGAQILAKLTSVGAVHTERT